MRGGEPPPLLMNKSSGRFLRSLGSRLCDLLDFLLRGELLPYLGGDGIGVHLVRGGRIVEDGSRVAARGREKDARLYQQPRECALVAATNERRKCLLDTSVVAPLTDAMLPRQHLKAVLFHDANQLLKNEKQVTLHQANRNGGAHSSKDAEAGCIGNGLILTLLLLLGLPLLIVAVDLRLGMMNRAGWVRADLVNSANVAAFGDDGLGSELAHLILRLFRIVFGLRLIVP